MGTKSLQHSRIVPISRLLFATIGKWSGHAKEGSSYCFRCQWIGTTPCSPIHSICRQKLGAYLTRFLSDAVPSHSHHQRAVGSQNGCLTHLAVAVGENKKSRKFTTFIHLINNWKFLKTFQVFFHGGSIGSLHDQIAPDLLPDEYGGSKGSLQEMLFFKVVPKNHENKFDLFQ